MDETVRVSSLSIDRSYETPQIARVTLCRDARSCVRCVKGYYINTLTSMLVSTFYNGRTTVRPYKGLLVSSNYSIGGIKKGV